MTTQFQNNAEHKLSGLISREKTEQRPSSEHIKALIRRIPDEKNNRLGLCEDGLIFLQSVKTKIALVTIFGEQRSGKSTLANILLRLSGCLKEDEPGFKVCESFTPVTAGIDICTIPIKIDDYSVFFLDSEGLGADGTTYDILIPNITTLISSHIVIHDQAKFSVPNLKFLNASFKLAETITGLNTTFPSLTWVIQKFNLSSSLSEKEFIEKELLNENYRDNDLKYTIESIRKMFPVQQIRAFRIPYPIGDISKFPLLDTMKFGEFTNEYRVEMNALLKRMLETRPHSFFQNRESTTGIVLASKLLELVNSVNNGGAAIYMQMLQYFVEEVRIQVEEKCVNEFNQVHFPCENDELDQIHNNLLSEFDKNVKSYKDDDDVQRIRTDLMNQLDQHLNIARIRNNEVILENTLTIVTRETLAECDVEVGKIKLPHKDLETPLGRIKQRTMNMFDQRLKQVADDHPQKKSFRSRLNNSVESQFRVLSARNVVDSLELLGKEVKDLSTKMENKGIFTRSKTLICDFQKRLNGLVVSKSCDSLVSQMEMAARLIEEYENGNQMKKVMIVATTAVVVAGVIVAPVIAVAASATAATATAVAATATATTATATTATAATAAATVAATATVAAVEGITIAEGITVGLTALEIGAFGLFGVTYKNVKELGHNRTIITNIYGQILMNLDEANKSLDNAVRTTSSAAEVVE